MTLPAAAAKGKRLPQSAPGTRNKLRRAPDRARKPTISCGYDSSAPENPRQAAVTTVPRQSTGFSRKQEEASATGSRTPPDREKQPWHVPDAECGRSPRPGCCLPCPASVGPDVPGVA